VKLLTAYRVLAYITGSLLILLVFVGIPLQIWGHNSKPVEILGISHGYVFIVYFLVALGLVAKYRLPIWRWVIVAAAGLVPFAAFFVEPWTTRWVREHEAARQQKKEQRAARARTNP
jgi:integral membrane protein